MRVLVIGAGSIGQRHIRCFQATGRARVSVCEIDASLLEHVKTRYQLDEAFENLDSTLLDPPDAAVVCTPAHLHVPMATQLARSGVHLLIEKPLSTGLDGIDRLREAAAASKVVTAVAYVYRAHPMLAAMQLALQAGQFGSPVQLVAVCGQDFAFHRPAYRETYYTSHATGGGAIQDALTHILNAAEWLLGPVSEVAADSAHRILEGVDVEDTVHVIGRHREVLAIYSLNQYQAPNEIVLTVVCEEGTARFEMHRNRWRWMSHPQADWRNESEPLERDTLFVNQAHSFLDAIEGTPPLCGLQDGLQTLCVNLAILEATKTHRWTTVRSWHEDADFTGRKI